jgi:glycosyltransferase involved in cell wall biosynthesis
MANIIVVGIKVPYTSGGQELLVRTLKAELERRGHSVDLVELPFEVNSRFSLIKQAALYRKLDFSRFSGKQVDLVIATKFPSYYIKHPRKCVWLVHQYRAIYDLFGSQFSDFSDDPRSEAIRQILTEGDLLTLGEAQTLACISDNVRQRLSIYNGLSGETIYPPLPYGDSYRSEISEPYLLSVGRMSRIKRIDLLIKALPQIDFSLKLKIVGTADDPEFFSYIKNEVRKHHLTNRVEFLGRVSEERLIDLYAKAFAVYYAPYDEDYGFSSLEAFASRKPVISAFDSGGVLEFVKGDGEEQNSIIVPPTIEQLASGINSLFHKPTEFTTQLGVNGRKLVEKFRLLAGWDPVIAKLTAQLSKFS